jgi:hypothetical protein
MIIKGVSKNVVVIRSPDPRYFEQAIFILRDEVVKQGGNTRERILQEAERVACEYLKTCKLKKMKQHISPLLIATISVILVGLILAVTGILF